jgi:hypothetical protein
MSDTLYNAKKYIRFDANEFLGVGVTALCISFVLSMRELLFTNFKEISGVESFVMKFVFLLFIILVCVYLCKIIAIRLGLVIKFHAHYLGLVLGIIITLMSVGYLPIFLPGGFLIDERERLRLGKWHGNYRKGWEVGLIAGTFPLTALVFVLLFSPLYLLTQVSLYADIVIACCLLAIYAMVPVPFWMFSGGDHWWTHLRDSSFGLDVIYSSFFWYFVLVITVLLFSVLAFILTYFDVRIGFITYIFSLLLAFAGVYIYSKFFKK